MSATAVGDISHPVERGSPTEELQQACGAPGALLPDAATRIVRTPYLQQLTTSSVIVGWVGSADGIEVTEPDGTKVTFAEATLEPKSKKQMWASVSGLEPDTIYCYTLVAKSSALSERIGFRTAPPADTKRKVRFLAFGDSGGGGADQFALLDHMTSVPYEFMIHTG